LGRLEDDIGNHLEITGIDERKKEASKNDVEALGRIEF
jgi:hypothetical protein